MTTGIRNALQEQKREHWSLACELLKRKLHVVLLYFDFNGKPAIKRRKWSSVLYTDYVTHVDPDTRWHFAWRSFRTSRPRKSGNATTAAAVAAAFLYPYYSIKKWTPHYPPDPPITNMISASVSKTTRIVALPRAVNKNTFSHIG